MKSMGPKVHLLPSCLQRHGLWKDSTIVPEADQINGVPITPTEEKSPARLLDTSVEDTTDGGRRRRKSSRLRFSSSIRKSFKSASAKRKSRKKSTDLHLDIDVVDYSDGNEVDSVVEDGKCIESAFWKLSRLRFGSSIWKSFKTSSAKRKSRKKSMDIHLDVDVVAYSDGNEVNGEC